jgi:hypothetical protein
VRFDRWSSYAALGALLFVLLSHWLLTLEPEIAPDALAMHLGIPESVATFHKWAFDFKQAVWAVMPMGADWCFTIVNLLGGEAAARLLNLAFLLAIVSLLVSMVRKWLPIGPSLLIVAMFAATPIVQLVTCSLFSENLWAALAFGSVWALYRYWEQGSKRLFYVAFVLLGGAAATKYAALAFLAPIVLIAFFALWSHSRMVRSLCGAIFVFLVFAASPYLTAYVKTGNPIYPFLNSVFRSPYFDSSASFTGAAANFPLTLRAPYDLTFHTSLLPEVQDGASGFQYFLFLPLALLLLIPLPIDRGSETGQSASGPALGWFSFVAAFLFTVLTMGIQPHIRYLYAAFPLATVVIAFSLARLKTLDRPLYRIAVSLSIAVFLLNLYFLPSADWFHKDYYVNASSSSARTQYLADHAPVRNLIEYLNRAHRGKPAAFFETNATAGLRGAAFTNSWHTPGFNTQLSSAQSPEDYLRLMRQYGVQYLIAPAAGSATPLSTTLIETFLARCTAAEFRSGGFYIASMGPDSGCASRSGPPPPPAPAGQYDDRDPRIVYERAWGRGRFAETSDGTLTASNSADATFRFSFNGAGVTYIYTKAFNRGIAEISIDGARQGDLDLYSPATEWQARTRVVCSQPGPHTLVVRVTGRKNPAAKDTYVDVDGLVVQ